MHRSPPLGARALARVGLSKWEDGEAAPGRDLWRPPPEAVARPRRLLAWQ